MVNYRALNGELAETCRMASQQFYQAIKNTERTQHKKLAQILRDNRDTDIGERHSFRNIKSVTDFRKAVPITTYEDYEDFIAQIADGKQRVLTGDRVLMLEPTSGSTSPSKFIPYTESLKREFQQGIWPWLYDILANRPKVANGSFYWSITPVTHKQERTSGGIPIGFGDDSTYFTPRQQELIAQLSAVPFDVAGAHDMDDFKKRTLSHLLSNQDLSFVSVWNPTFLSLLLRNVKDPSKYWPNLSLISCWGDGNAANYIGEVTKLFPDAEIQRKGLIATEGLVSFPLFGDEGSALSVNSHFFEFRDITNTSDVRLAHEVETGREYETILTTSGGLYRYNLEDIVRVVGFKDQCPLLRFVGRNNNISDLFGEKLNERHVSEVVAGAFRKHTITPSFFIVAPERTGNQEPPNYTLFIEFKGPFDAKLISDELDEQLQTNYHYKYSRKLGQLGKPQVFLVESDRDNTASDIYLKESQSQGKKIGNVKPSALNSQIGWSKRFKGRFL